MLLRTVDSAPKLTAVDTETVIQEVRQRPCLWNQHDEFYKNKLQKQKAWREICEKIVPNCNSCTKEEQKFITRAVQARWKTARDAYMKCRFPTRTASSVYRGKNKYAFYDQLTFLEHSKETPPFLQTATQQENNVTEDTEVVQDDEDSDGNANEGEIEAKVEVDDDATSSHNDPLETEDMEPEPQRKRMRYTPRRRAIAFKAKLLRYMQQNSTNTSPLLKDDQAFFNSLAPFISDFDKHKKLVLRSSIIEIVKQLRGLEPIFKQEPTDFDTQNNSD